MVIGAEYFERPQRKEFTISFTETYTAHKKYFNKKDFNQYSK
jgi:hypothetical protein